MSEIGYKHPDYKPSEARKDIIKNENEHKIIRIEYPDGVIVVFEIKADGVHVDSNYNYSIDTKKKMIFPDLYSLNLDFKDYV